MFRLLSAISIFIFASIGHAVEDKCAYECSADCTAQVESAQIELTGHLRTCADKDPGPAVTECGRACSRGCKSFMRGQRGIITDHYAKCGGGSGAFGELLCIEENNLFYVFNTHNMRKLGEGHALSSKCEETAETKNYTLFCAKVLGGYAVLSFVSGDQMGDAVPFLDRCDEFMQNIKREKICVFEGEGYQAYSIETYRPVGKFYAHFPQCYESL